MIPGWLFTIASCGYDWGTYLHPKEGKTFHGSVVLTGIHKCLLQYSAVPLCLVFPFYLEREASVALSLFIIIMFVTFVLQTDSTRHVVTRLLLSHSKKSGTCLCSRATRVDHHSCTSTSAPSSRIWVPTYTQIKYKLST